MPVRDSIFGKRCALFKNATSLALCSNITDMEADVSDVPASTDILCLSGSGKVIKGGSFNNFKQLMYLALKMPITEIHPQAFKGLENLQSLSIIFSGSHKCNNLSIPEDIFANMHELKILNLEGFHLTKSTLIRLHPFTNMHTLSLPQNCITDLFHVFNIFQGIISIHTLDVGKNKIQVIEDTGLQNKPITDVPNITELNLSENPLKRVKPKAFARFHFNLLNLDFTPLNLSDLFTSGITKLDSLSVMSNFKPAVNKTQLLCSIAARLQLKILFLPVNRISAVHANDLSNCYSLETLNLNHNRMKTVDPNILYKLLKVRSLYLSYNNLNINLCPESNNNNFSSSLQLLHFSNNNVTFLKNRQFSCMPHILELVLNNNGIKFIEESAFRGLTKLQILDLTNNKLTEIPRNSLSGLFNLKHLYLKSNDLHFFSLLFFKDQTQLQDMDCGAVSGANTVLDLFPSLQILNIQNKAKYFHIQVANNINSSLHTLVFNGSSLNIDAKCHHTLFINLRVLKIRNNEDFTSCASSGSPMQHFKKLETLQYHFNGNPVPDRKLNFSNMPSLKNLDVQNLATALTNPKINPFDLFQKLYKLEIFKLVNSGFKYFTASLFKDMKSLKILTLENGLILLLDSGIQASLDHASFIYFYDMTFQCDCGNSWFVNWALKQKQTFVSSIDNEICLELNKQFNLLTFVEKSCHEDIGFVLFLVTFSSLSIFIILMLIYSIFTSSIIQLFYIFQVWLHKLRGKKCDLIKYDYDAFVSYCSMDQDWVLQYFIPNLEEKGPPFLKLCLHNRDFQVGKDIVDNIMDSIYKSRKTICLISRNYLTSEWCSLEMRMATYRTLEEKNDDLILLFLERISRYKLSSYHSLAKMVKKKTYIDWPVEENEQIAFWERLKMTIMDAQSDQAMH
ncbi:toll-like receptor 12 [Discoglossus pictus]